MDKVPVWYAAKCIFYYRNLINDLNQPTFEERIILLRAKSFDDAILFAEEEACEYAARGSVTCEYTGYVQVYELDGQEITHKAEIFSLMRSSALPIQDYIDTFYDTGSERQT